MKQAAHQPQGVAPIGMTQTGASAQRLIGKTRMAIESTQFTASHWQIPDEFGFR